MLLLKLKAIAAAAILAAPVSYGLAYRASPPRNFAGPDMIELRAGTVTYKPAGDYTRADKTANAPVVAIRLPPASRS